MGWPVHQNQPRPRHVPAQVQSLYLTCLSIRSPSSVCSYWQLFVQSTQCCWEWELPYGAIIAVKQFCVYFNPYELKKSTNVTLADWVMLVVCTECDTELTPDLRVEKSYRKLLLCPNSGEGCSWGHYLTTSQGSVLKWTGSQEVSGCGQPPFFLHRNFIEQWV